MSVRAPRPARLKLSLPTPLERFEQETYFSWLHYQKFNGERVGDYAFAVPNGSYLHGSIAQRAIQGNALRRQGVRVGVPDVFIEIPIAPYHGLRIEFKRIGGPGPKEDQVRWHTKLMKMGYAVFTAYGFAQARVFTQQYLGLTREPFEHD